ncbi:hypothetical protein GQX74_006124 [Glossina fuscipes]|nr:hypothetical protein GQX74_006124 [Glossina fuscipes]
MQSNCAFRLFKFIRSGGLNPLLENESFPMKRVYEISILQITRPNVKEKSVAMPLAYFQTPSHSLILSTTFFWQSKTFSLITVTNFIAYNANEYKRYCIFQVNSFLEDQQS